MTWPFPASNLLPPGPRDLVVSRVRAGSPVLAHGAGWIFPPGLPVRVEPLQQPRNAVGGTINPHRGCGGCKYCYARYTHEFLGMEDPAEFEEKIYSKERAGEILRRELSKDPGGAIAIGTATDPYQPAERLYGATRGILETLAKFRGLHLSITTKSDLILRDAAWRAGELTPGQYDHHHAQPELARILEPRAPQPSPPGR